MGSSAAEDLADAGEPAARAAQPEPVAVASRQEEIVEPQASTEPEPAEPESGRAPGEVAQTSIALWSDDAAAGFRELVDDIADGLGRRWWPRISARLRAKGPRHSAPAAVAIGSRPHPKRRPLLSPPPSPRAVLDQPHVAGHTASGAAAALGIPVGTVKSRLHYALQQLRRALDGYPRQQAAA